MIRVVIIDDDPEVREGLRLILGAEPDIVVVGEAPDGLRGVQTVRRLRADVVLVDMVMPGIGGVETTRQLRTLDPAPRVLVLTAFDTGDATLEVLASGACGYLLKNFRPRELPHAVRETAAGRSVLAPAVTSSVIRHAVSARPTERAERALDVDDLADLTDRERELASAVGEGLTNAQIAAALGISPASAKTFVSRLLDKLGLSNRTQLAIAAYRAGLLDG